jgi:hypothetical protein
MVRGRLLALDFHPSSLLSSDVAKSGGVDMRGSSTSTSWNGRKLWLKSQIGITWINALVRTAAIPLHGVDFWHIFETQVILTQVILTQVILTQVILRQNATAKTFTSDAFILSRLRFALPRRQSPITYFYDDATFLLNTAP